MTLYVRTSNNATGTITGAINTVATTVSVQAGEGLMFPAAATGTIYFYATLQKDDGNWEIVKVTNKATDTFTITRNIDSSTGSAQSFSEDDIISLRPVSEIFDDYVTEFTAQTAAIALKGDADALSAPAGTKMVFYQNTAPTGWTTDGAVADAVIAIKGGSNAYNASGGTLVGTWTQTGHTHTGPSHTHTGPSHTHTLGSHTHGISELSHNHQVYDYMGQSNPDRYYDSDGNVQDLQTQYKLGIKIWAHGTENWKVGHDMYTSNALTSGSTDAASGTESGAGGTGATGSGGTGATGSSGEANTYRPYAALCIVASKDA